MRLRSPKAGCIASAEVDLVSESLSNNSGPLHQLGMPLTPGITAAKIGMGDQSWASSRVGHRGEANESHNLF
jgi:hypothetical protein